MNATQTLNFTCPHCNTIVDVLPHSGQELVTCPACSKPFQVTVPEGKPVDALVVPAASANGVVENETEEEKRPVLMAQNVNEQEDHIRTIQLGMFRRYPFRVAGYVLLVGAGLVLGAWAMSNEWTVSGWLLFAAAAFAVVRLFLWWLRMKNTTLTITNRRCIVETGILSKQANEVPTKDISEINVSQDFVTRILNIGDLTIVSGGSQPRSLVVMAVPDPAEVAAQIRGKGVGPESVPH